MNELGERRDLKEEAEHEEYLTMCDQVRDEILRSLAEVGIPKSVIKDQDVHEEAMRRLKAKYESACGK